MPRPSASSKRQQASTNHRDTRHENGLVGPGKRIQKQKSQGHLASNGRPVDDGSSSVPPVPSTPPSTANGHSKQSADITADNKSPESIRRTSLGGYSESSSSESYNSNLGQNGIPEENHRRIDVNATKNTNVHKDPGPLDFALTVLRSCPVQDTIAILILLMQVPSIALAGIYMLFSILTMMNTSSGVSLTDMLEWNLGAPSLATVICVDGIVLLIWLFLPGTPQHIVLDLAQMVIALGLGGGASTGDGSTANIFICLSMIALSHILRRTPYKTSPLGYVLGSSRFLTFDPDDPLESIPRSFDDLSTTWLGWIRNILAIHILTQGVVRFVRDWLLRRERRDLLLNNLGDPEAGKAFVAEGNDGGFATPDSDSVSLQATNSALSTKKKRKQSAQIRNRQPLWAALASTKIVVVKEYELSSAASESAGSNATDIHNLGNAPFNTQPEQIWISYIGCDEVCFNTSHFPNIRISDADENGVSNEAARPFYVRVNNAVWQPTRMAPVDDCDGKSYSGTRWSGDIYGLTPMSNYECEFVNALTGEVIFTTSVRTTQAKSADLNSTTGKAANGQRSMRPDSPTTTLKNSIAQNEKQLTTIKDRQKAMRKDFQKKLNALRKETDKLSVAAQSAGKDDDKFRQKIQQNTTQQKQAEAATAALEDELKELHTIPASLRTEWSKTQTAWNSEKIQFEEVLAEHKTFKAGLATKIQEATDEKSSLQNKRNKISTRIAKVDGELARITDANNRGLDEAERRMQLRAAISQEQQNMERSWRERAMFAEGQLELKSQHVAALKAQLDTVHTQSQQLAAFAGSYDFAEGASNSFPNPLAQQSNNGYTHDPWANSAYAASLWGSGHGGIHAGAGSGPGAAGLAGFPPAGSLPVKSRGRSSSMLSDVSGFTQSSTAEDDSIFVPGLQHSTTSKFDYGPSPPGYGRPTRGREGSGGGSSVGSSESPSSSSGSGSGGSVRDPMSPV